MLTLRRAVKGSTGVGEPGKYGLINLPSCLRGHSSGMGHTSQRVASATQPYYCYHKPYLVLHGIAARLYFHVDCGNIAAKNTNVMLIYKKIY